MSLMDNASAKEIDIANQIAVDERFGSDPVDVYHELLGEYGAMATARIWRVATRVWERNNEGR